jgi:hypothetical protein
MTKTPRIRAGVFPTSGQPIALDRSACWLRLIEACRNAVINPLYQPGNRIFGCCEHNVVLKDVI